MAADIHTFLSNFRGGGARPNRYEVHLTFPGAVPLGTVAAEKISFTCSTAAIPASNLGVVNVPYKGREVKVPGDKVWDDWSVQIILDSDWLGRSVFETWQDLLLGFRSNVAQPNMINPVNAYASAHVHQLDRADNIIETYQVEGMFPTMVGEVSLGYQENDTVMFQPVTFAINGWSSSRTT